jgi:hypothetical protein
MNVKQLFRKHYSRLVLEAVIKSVLAGLAMGCGANFLAALAAWIFDFGGVWLVIGVGGGVWLISSLLFFFLKYKPSVSETAERMDRLGLSERMITMLELQGDDSYIASVQRENARASIARVANRKIRLRVSKVAIVLAAVALVLGSSMTTIKGLSDSGEIPNFNEIVEDDPYANYIPVTYMVEEGGWIEGESDQLVEPGGSTTSVIAMAEDGWVFEGWDDGYAGQERSESNVTAELYFVAIFVQIEDGEGGADGDGEGGKEGSQTTEGDKAEDLPANGGANVESDQSGAEGSEGDGSGSKGESDGGQGSSDEQGEGKGDGKGQGAGGKWEDANQFLNGKEYYRDYLELYYLQALEIFEQNGEIPPELREFFETYFESI